MKRILFLSVILISLLLLVNKVPALCVKVDTANLRTGPGTNYKIIWEVYKYMPLVRVGTSLSGKWYAVSDVDGDVSWISQNLVTSKWKCAVVNTSDVNVRECPKISCPKDPISPLPQYYSLRVLSQKKQWVKVKDEEGNVGWINSQYLWIR